MVYQCSFIMSGIIWIMNHLIFGSENAASFPWDQDQHPAGMCTARLAAAVGS